MAMKAKKRRIGIWKWALPLVGVLGLAGPAHQAFATGGTWTTLATMLQGAGAVAGGGIEGLLYVASGDTYPYWQMVQAYYPLTNTWTAKSPIPIPVGGTAPVVINGKLSVVGGAAYHSYWINTLQIYDPATDWEKSLKMDRRAFTVQWMRFEASKRLLCQSA